MKREPQTLMEAVRYFADADRTLETMVSLRWPNGVHCPTCGRTDVRFLATRRLWECKEKHPRKQFSAKVGTIFEDSALPLDKWFVAVWSIANCKNGISSYELARAIGVTQKSAWHMLHRIRLAMEVGGIDKFSGPTEADETYIGPVAGNMHKQKREALRGGLKHYGKATVMGVMQRTSDKEASRIRALPIRDANAKTMQRFVREHVEVGTDLHTDSHSGYRGLAADYVHQTVHHAALEYVRGNVHTNGIENFWSLLKRGLKGTYVSVEPFHLGRYVSEQVFRFNERTDNDGGRFRKVLSSVVGKRLTYQELITHGAPQGAH
jgi:transposase-like protein